MARMRLYHFINKKYGLESLNLNRLKIAQIDQLNDPFELLGVELSNPVYRDLIYWLKHGFSKDFGLLCFSASYHSPALWAHYADNHKGFCLGFDFEAKNCKKVHYRETRLSIDEFMDNQLHRSDVISAEIINEIEQLINQGQTVESQKILDFVATHSYADTLADDEGRDFMMRIVSTKFSHWSYEEEYRFFVELNSCTGYNGLYFFDYCDEMMLQQIIVGLNSSVSRSEIEQLLNDTCGVDIFKVRKDYREFKLVCDENY